MADELDGTSDRLAGIEGQMDQLEKLSTQFGRSLSRSLAQGIAQGKSFDDVLRSLGQRLIDISLRAAFKPLESGVSSLFGGLTNLLSGAVSGGVGDGGLFSSTGFGGGSTGGLFSSGNVTVNMAVSTPDAESFRRSEGQVSAALARAVSRGQRNL
jgi:phage-related minor tail protein